jgi:hypothetical protein
MNKFLHGKSISAVVVGVQAGAAEPRAHQRCRAA